MSRKRQKSSASMLCLTSLFVQSTFEETEDATVCRMPGVFTLRSQRASIEDSMLTPKSQVVLEAVQGSGSGRLEAIKNMFARLANGDRFLKYAPKSYNRYEPQTEACYYKIVMFDPEHSHENPDLLDLSIAQFNASTGQISVKQPFNDDHIHLMPAEKYLALHGKTVLSLNL